MSNCIKCGKEIKHITANTICIDCQIAEGTMSKELEEFEKLKKEFLDNGGLQIGQPFAVIIIHKFIALTEHLTQQTAKDKQKIEQLECALKSATEYAGQVDKEKETAQKRIDELEKRLLDSQPYYHKEYKTLRTNITKAINEIEEDRSCVLNETGDNYTINQRLAEIDNCLDIITKALEVKEEVYEKCPDCNGQGRTEEGEGTAVYWENCKKCNSTGRIEALEVKE